MPNGVPPTGAYKALPANILQDLRRRARHKMDQHLEKAEQRMAAMTEEMVGKACETIRQAAKVGPKLAGHLDAAASAEAMSVSDIESASRSWDRLMMSSRKVLGMDQEQQAVNLNVAIVSLPDRAELRQAEAEPAVDVECAAIAGPDDCEPLSPSI